MDGPAVIVLVEQTEVDEPVDGLLVEAEVEKHVVLGESSVGELVAAEADGHDPVGERLWVLSGDLADLGVAPEAVGQACVAFVVCHVVSFRARYRWSAFSMRMVMW